MKNLISNIKQDHYEFMNFTSEDNPHPTELKFAAYILRYAAVTGYNRTIGRLLCRWFGHGSHYHCEDWANQDTGGVAGYCDRCGWSLHQTLY
jgi:hypothetical protein